MYTFTRKTYINTLEKKKLIFTWNLEYTEKNAVVFKWLTKSNLLLL